MKAFIQKLSQQKKEFRFKIHYGKILLCGIPTLFFYINYKTTLFLLNTFQPEFISSLRTSIYLFLHQNGLYFIASNISLFVFIGILLGVSILVFRTQEMFVS